MSQGRSFVLTCHHVLYGEGICKNSFDVKDISLAVGDSTVPAIDILTQHETSELSDVTIIELSNNNTLPILAELSLSLQVDISKLGTNCPQIITSHPQESAIAQIALNQEIRSVGIHDIEGSVNKGSFHNLNRGIGGAIEYKGISGSGVFVSFNEKIILLGILSKLPKSSMEEQIVFKRLDSVKDDVPGIQTLEEIMGQIEPHGGTAPLRDVCFVNYTERSKDFYCVRQCDDEFNANINDKMNTWLHGESGTGKTALIMRNLKESNISNIYCDLEPITIDSLEDILRGIAEGISMYQNYVEIPQHLDAKTMSSYLNGCKLKDNTVIVIDEMSCSDINIINQFCTVAVKLVRFYQKSNPDKNIIFVISSIFPPVSPEGNRGKLIESFEFIHSNEWEGKIEGLFDIQNRALGQKICETGRDVIITSSKRVPRLMSKFVHRIYRSNKFSVEEIRATTQKVIAEYNEYE